MINILYDNILNSNEDAIATLVDCNGEYISSITESIYSKYKIDKNIYYLACNYKEPRLLLGKNFIMKQGNKFIINMFSLCSFKSPKETVHINSFIECLNEVKQFCSSRNLTVALSMDIKHDTEDKRWLIVEDILNSIFSDLDLYLYLEGNTYGSNR